MNRSLMPTARMWTIAHRAGNDLERLRAAEAVGVDLIEADVWLCRGRLEVRHEKTMGPIPLLWDRWYLTRGRSRLLLADLLRAVQPRTMLMLDLKGTASALPGAVLDAVERHAPDRPLAVCSRAWGLLEPFRGRASITVIYSVGTAAQLRALGPRRAGDGGAISIHERLLHPAAVRGLKASGASVITWPVNTVERVCALRSLGVDGIISDSLALLRQIIDERRATAGP